MKIPSSIEDATLDLKGLGELIIASEWKRAAIVWAFTTNRQGQRTSPTSGIGVIEFAALGITGLQSKNTVTKYRKAWAKAIADGVATDVKPGDVIELPAVEWQTYFTPVDREVTGQDGNTYERQGREWNPPPEAPLGNDRASASLLCDSDDFPSTLKLVGKNINNLLAAYTLNLTQIEQFEGLLHKTLRTLGKRASDLRRVGVA